MKEAAFKAAAVQEFMERPKAERSEASAIYLRRFSEIEPEPIRWLWPGRIARGKASMLAGHPGLGKSQLTAYLAAIVSEGGTWPDGGRADRGAVLILNAEDDAADTIAPRLHAARADLERIYSLDAVAAGYMPDGSEARRPFDLSEDIGRLREVVERVGDVALIVIDPITAYLGSTDSHKNAELRALLAPLSDLAAEAGAAVVAVSHLNKGGNADALLRVMGSLAFVAAARAAWIVAKDPDDDALRLFLPLKNNIAKDGGTGLAFHVEGVTLPSARGQIETSRIVWHAGAVERTADEVMAASRGGDEERGALEEAKDWLAELLADGPLPSKKIRSAASDSGFSWRTIERAKAALGVKAGPGGYQGGWGWWLPASESATQSASPSNSADSGELGGLCADQASERRVMEVEL